jgi:hypothetical protein
LQSNGDRQFFTSIAARFTIDRTFMSIYTYLPPSNNMAEARSVERMLNFAEEKVKILPTSSQFY